MTSMDSTQTTGRAAAVLAALLAMHGLASAHHVAAASTPTHRPPPPRRTHALRTTTVSMTGSDAMLRVAVLTGAVSPSSPRPPDTRLARLPRPRGMPEAPTRCESSASAGRRPTAARQRQRRRQGRTYK